jgi:hypothetical protein
MSDERAVVPWLDEGSDASEDLRKVLASAKGDGLSAAQVDALSKKVLALTAGATAATSIAPAASSVGLSASAKITAVVTVLALGGAGVWAARSRGAQTAIQQEIPRRPSSVARTTNAQPSRANTVPVVARSDADAGVALPSIGDALRGPTPTLTPPQRSARTAHTINTTRALPVASREDAGSVATVRVEVPAPNPADDAGLLHRAAAALRSGATVEAMELLSRHRQLFASSARSEERERIGIEALVRAGQRERAQREAARFRQRFPGSAQQPRIDVLVRGEEQQ